jgi:hypothetical protein
MTIYVRTQDKAKIFEINSVSYEEKKKTSRTVYGDNVTSETVESKHILSGSNKVLGEYISKERCLEIMTEIQNTIANHNPNTTIVYNMPER